MMGLHFRYAPALLAAVILHFASAQPVTAGPYPPIGPSGSEWTCDTSGDCGGDGDSCCDVYDVFCEKCPTFTSQVKFVYMRRDRTSDPAILQDVATNQFVLRGNDFDFDFVPGVDGNVIYHMNSVTSIEGRYLWVDDWTDGVSTPNPGQLRFTTNPFTGNFASDFYSTYSSSLQTAEVNLRQTSGDITWLIGFRWAEIDESLQANEVGGPSINDFDTRNDLFGGQIGAEAALMSRGRFSLDTFGKLGWYANRAEGVSRVQVGNTVFGTARDRRTESALLAEAGLEGVFRLNDFLALRAGYQVLIAHGLAVAAEQVKKSGDLLGGGGAGSTVGLNLDTSSHLFAHGGTVGVELNW